MKDLFEFEQAAPSVARSAPKRSATNAPEPTEVFDTYWRFAAERQATYERRLRSTRPPWTDDAILRRYRFTNAFRASDRVSQFLIKDVQYAPDRSQETRELFFRTMLFKIFNKIETWEWLERHCGELNARRPDYDRLDAALERMRQGGPIYSAAYIMPSPKMGRERKHSNHLMLLRKMMADNLPERIRQAQSLSHVYELLLSYPGVGRFLAFQYTIDLNYSAMLDFDEDAFVVAGPGALDGISKCFSSTAGWSPERIIMWVTERQDREFADRGISFSGLWGRRLKPIDCQNLFCEISKYARVAHPNVGGVTGRTRIKQGFRLSPRPLPTPFFPPRWRINIKGGAAAQCAHEK